MRIHNANTIREMISLLEDYPLATELQDTEGNGFTIHRVVTSASQPGMPILTLTKHHGAFIKGSTVLELMATLIDIMMDERFRLRGDSSLLMQEGTNYRNTSDSKIETSGGFSLKRGHFYPYVLLQWYSS